MIEPIFAVFEYGRDHRFVVFGFLVDLGMDGSGDVTSMSNDRGRVECYFREALVDVVVVEEAVSVTFPHGNLDFSSVSR